eukprot:XP_011666898.1 PREDICTED: stromelysin-3-like [Strongylocentrotus purpuratus]
MSSRVILSMFVFCCVSRVLSAPAWKKTTETSFEEQTGLTPNAKRCGVEDMMDIDMSDQLPGETKGLGRFTPKGGRWTKNNLTYHIKSFTPDLSRLQTRNAIRRAFQLWANVSPLSFNESSNATADIVIDFVTRYEHNDAYPMELKQFDGPGGYLAHASYPPHGIVHFDEDETYTVMTLDGVDLAIVAAHEFGHVLGLGHSSNSHAVMSPIYNGFVEDFNLHQDDIDGIQYLYGYPDVDLTLTKLEIGTSDIENLPACDSPWDAATYYAPGDVVYAFKGQFVWAINDQGVVEGYPTKTNNVFSEAPSNVHSVVSAGSRTYMFKGNNIWRFFGKQLEPGFPRPRKNSFPHSTDAALIDDGKIYILKGGRYYEFFENDLNIGWSKKIRHHWRGIPANIDAALQGRNGTTYFFKNDNYWKFEDSKMVGAYRKSRSKDWIGCGSF